MEEEWIYGKCLSGRWGAGIGRGNWLEVKNKSDQTKNKGKDSVSLDEKFVEKTAIME